MNNNINEMYPNMISPSNHFAKALHNAINLVEKDTEPTEWITIKGYKATDADMKCKDFQYAFDQVFTMDEDDINECASGFHLCRDLTDVFHYYCIGGGNRFFEVEAMVRKEDFDAYGRLDGRGSFGLGYSRKDKLVAKKIRFIRELTADEILMHDAEARDWTDDMKQLALKHSVLYARNWIRAEKLIERGYSEPYAMFVVNCGKYDRALALESQPGLSMDMKAALTFMDFGD